MKMHPLALLLVSGLVPVALTSPAQACGYCEPSVSFTPELAACYLNRVEQEIANMQAASLPAQLINLGSCDGATSATRGSVSIPLPGGGEQAPTTSFLMDAAGLRCLARDLADEDWDPEVFKTFVITRDCDDQ